MKQEDLDRLVRNHHKETKEREWYENYTQQQNETESKEAIKKFGGFIVITAIIFACIFIGPQACNSIDQALIPLERLAVNSDQQQAVTGNSIGANNEEKGYTEGGIYHQCGMQLSLNDLKFKWIGHNLYLTGKIKNFSGVDYKYASVTFTLKNKSGENIGWSIDSIEGLPSGEIWKYKALVTEEDEVTTCVVNTMYGSH